MGTPELTAIWSEGQVAQGGEAGGGTGPLPRGLGASSR